MQKSTNDLVSIVIPTYERPRLLQRAIGSVLSQSYDNIEVLVIDDSERCEGLEVCAGFHDPRIRAYRNRRGKGACGSRNTGIELAQGAFYTGLDDDDYFHNDRISVLMDAYRKTHSFVASNILQVREQRKSPRFRGGRAIRLSDILWGNCVGNQIFTETSKVRSVGGFDEDLEAGQDVDLWIRMIERWGDALRIERCLYMMDYDHGEARISTTVEITRRVSGFLERHGDKLSTAQRLLYAMRMRSGRKAPYLALAAATLVFPGSWNYWIKRTTRVW
ncbi:MAG: glycosyltransferase [Spirochaetaceae bacterium]|nr:glycosyltransferase [Spirochaetaceae bacterium]